MKQADQNSSVAFGTSRSETIQRGESEEKDSTRQKVFPLSGEFSVVFNFFFSLSSSSSHAEEEEEKGERRGRGGGREGGCCVYGEVDAWTDQVVDGIGFASKGCVCLACDSEIERVKLNREREREREREMY